MGKISLPAGAEYVQMQRTTIIAGDIVIRHYVFSYLLQEYVCVV